VSVEIFLLSYCRFISTRSTSTKITKVQIFTLEKLCASLASVFHHFAGKYNPQYCCLSICSHRYMRIRKQVTLGVIIGGHPLYLSNNNN